MLPDLLKTYRVELTLSMVAPVITQGLKGKLLGVDTAAWSVRHNGEDYPALPGTLIRGNLLYAWKQLIALSDQLFMTDRELEQWLGGEAGEYNQPQRALLRSSDYWLAEHPVNREMRYRIKIDDTTGAVETGQIQAIEAPHPAGKPINYTGWFEFCAVDETEARMLREQLKKGFQYVPALGAFKNIGFGRIEEVSVGEVTKVDPKPIAIPVEKGVEGESGQDVVTLGFSFGLDRPVCFAKPHANDNRFESVENIPGAAFKGALVNRMNELDAGGEHWQTLRENVEKLVITHATPYPNKPDKDMPAKRSIPVPLSWYSSGGEIKDAAVSAIAIDSTLTEAPCFQLDWKNEWGIANKICRGYGEEYQPQRSLRVRTKVDEATQSAEDEKLFSQEVVFTDQHRWLMNISWANVAAGQRATLLSELSEILGHGIHSLGKTRAQTTVMSFSSQTYDYQLPSGLTMSELQKGQLIYLLLVSDARLLKDQLDIPATQGYDALFKEYKESWLALSGDSLGMKTFFAQQQLYGGDYYHQRFRSNTAIAGAYNPVLLTRAGSVFVLEVKDVTGAETCLAAWSGNGLPQLAAIRGGEDWRHNPLLAANGYGEVLLMPEIPPIRLTEEVQEDE